MLGGHARPRQSAKDREGPLRDSEGRQNGNYLHVVRGAEETELSTGGECAGHATASGDRGVARHYETRNSPKAAMTRW